MNGTHSPVYVDRRPPAAHDNSAKLTGLGALTAIVVAAMGVLFWVLAADNGNDEQVPAAQGEEPLASAAPAAPEPSPSPTPTPAAQPAAVPAPPAPNKSELLDNDWLLARYTLVNEDGNLTVAGTVKNESEQQRSGIIRVFVYSDGRHIATAAGEVRGVPGGQVAQVSLPSGTPYSPGEVLLVQAENL